MNKEKRVKGQITILASLIIIMIMALITAAIQSASLTASKIKADLSANLALESVFSGYSNELLDAFDILLIKDSEQLNINFQNYINENIQYVSGLQSVKLENLDIRKKVKATDAGGIVIKNEVLEFMKYGIGSEFIQMLLNREEELHRSQKTKETVDKITECEQGYFKADGEILRLIEVTEGLKTTENGFVIKKDMPVASMDHFVKKICFGETSRESVGVENSKVYSSLSDQYEDVSEILDNMRAYAEALIEDGEEVSARSGINSYDAVFLRNADHLKELIEGTLEKAAEALEIIQNYKSTISSLETTLDDVYRDVDTNKELLGDELSKTFFEDIENLKEYDQAKTIQLCDVGIIQEGLKQKIKILDPAKTYAGRFQIRLTEENASQMLKDIDEFADMISEINHVNLPFHYESVDFSSDSEGLGIIKSVQRLIAEGIKGLVIDDNSEISEKFIEFKDLASAYQNNSEGKVQNEPLENVLYNEYLFQKFDSYTDVLHQKKEGVQNNSLLEYQLEYILCGKNKDSENLSETILKLSALREGMNLMYIFTDTQKKAESYALALSLLGFTGIHGVIKAGQYLILSVWAYGEAIMDLRELYKGNKVELIKTRENWKLSLENLLKMNFTGEDVQNQKGLTYEEYLKMLLLIEEPSDKYYRTMDEIELKMMEYGNLDFRMHDYIYEMEVSVQFVLNRKKYSYKKELTYSY